MAGNTPQFGTALKVRFRCVLVFVAFISRTRHFVSAWRGGTNVALRLCELTEDAPHMVDVQTQSRMGNSESQGGSGSGARPPPATTSTAAQATQNLAKKLKILEKRCVVCARALCSFGNVGRVTIHPLPVPPPRPTHPDSRPLQSCSAHAVKPMCKSKWMRC